MFDLTTLLLELYAIAPLVSYVALSFIFFAESGLFFGFFLPGDSLLITAGLLATQGFFDIKILLLIIPFTSIAGNLAGYWMGGKFGRKLFKNQKKYVQKAESFYRKHGGKAIILARFVPIIRTFAPIVAGIAQMDYKRFMLFNIIGGLLWTWGILLIGYFLGSVIPGVEQHLFTIIIVIVIVSLIPFLIEVYKKHQSAKS